MALFASATLLPTSTSLAVAAEHHQNAEDQSLAPSKKSRRTVRRTRAVRNLPPIITALDHRGIESPLSSIASGSGASHASSISAELLSYSPPPHDSPVWDDEDDRTPGFGELFRRFTVLEAEFGDLANAGE